MAQTQVSLYAVGDLHADRDNPESIFAQVASTLKEADILFGQLESNLSKQKALQMHVYDWIWVDPKNISAYTSTGFHVLSFASNHTLDLGEEGLANTIALVKQSGIALIGVGDNLAEARQPAVLERKGTKVAFLAYCSALPSGYEARPDKSWAAPARASAYYSGTESWQPGMPPRVITIANKEDLEVVKEDIRKVRPLADVVVVSMH